MVELAAHAELGSDLSGRYEAIATRMVLPRGLIRGQPAMLQIGDDAVAIGEDHFPARPTELRVGRSKDRAGKAILVEDLIARTKASHRDPARGRGDGCIDGQCLP